VAVSHAAGKNRNQRGGDSEKWMEDFHILLLLRVEASSVQQIFMKRSFWQGVAFPFRQNQGCAGILNIRLGDIVSRPPGRIRFLRY
jgi:hypothetical protein